MNQYDSLRPWYHGSPLQLDELLEGSTITQRMDLARIFSHKPAIVSIDDDGPEWRLRHNGVLPGYLYRIAEPVTPDDVYPHPHTSMPPGAEWLIRRPLRVELIGPTTVRSNEFLSPDDVRELQARLQS